MIDTIQVLNIIIRRTTLENTFYTNQIFKFTIR